MFWSRRASLMWSRCFDYTRSRRSVSELLFHGALVVHRGAVEDAGETVLVAEVYRAHAEALDVDDVFR